MNVYSNDTEEINTFAKKDKVYRWCVLANYLYNIYVAIFHLQLFLAVLAKPGTVKT